MVEYAKKCIQLEISKTMAKRVKRKILTQIERDFKDDYRRIWDYVEELRQTNEGSSVEVLCEKGTSMFSKI